MVILLVGVGLLALAAVALLWTRGRRPAPIVECAGGDLVGDHYEVCGRRLSGRHVHRLLSTWDDPETPGGGTGVAVTYCGRHCPGGCQKRWLQDRRLASVRDSGGRDPQGDA